MIAVAIGSMTGTEPTASANVVAHNFGVTYLEDGNPAIKIVAQGTVPAGNGDNGGCAPGGAGTPLALIALCAVMSGLFVRRRITR